MFTGGPAQVADAAHKQSWGRCRCDSSYFSNNRGKKSDLVSICLILLCFTHSLQYLIQVKFETRGFQCVALVQVVLRRGNRSGMFGQVSAPIFWAEKCSNEVQKAIVRGPLLWKLQCYKGHWIQPVTTNPRINTDATKSFFFHIASGRRLKTEG